MKNRFSSSCFKRLTFALALLAGVMAFARDTDPMDIILGTDWKYGEPDYDRHPCMDYDYVRLPATDEVTLGRFNEGVERCRKFAEANGVPMMAMWSNEGCAHCKATEWGLLNTNFTAWAKQSGIVFVFSCSRDKPNGKIDGDEYNWCWGPGKKLKQYPFVRFYWKVPGEASARVDKCVIGEDVTAHFGVDGDKKSRNRAGNAAKAFVQNIFKDYHYVDYDGGEIDSVSPNPLYAGKISSTEVKLVRVNNVDRSSSNYVEISYLPESVAAPSRQTVLWAKGETDKTISFPVSLNAKDGNKAVISVFDAAGKIHAAVTNDINLVYMGGAFAGSSQTANLYRDSAIELELKRETFTEYVYTNAVAIAYPTGYGLADHEIKVVWSAGATQRKISIPLDTDWQTPGAVITARLKDEQGKLCGNDVANSGALITLNEPPFCGGKITAGGNLESEIGQDATVKVVLKRDSAQYDGSTVLSYDYTGFSRMEDYVVPVADAVAREATATVLVTNTVVHTLTLPELLTADSGAITGAVFQVVRSAEEPVGGTMDFAFAAQDHALTTYINPAGTVTTNAVEGAEPVKSVVLPETAALQTAIEVNLPEKVCGAEWRAADGAAVDSETESQAFAFVVPEPTEAQTVFTNTFTIASQAAVSGQVTVSSADVTSAPQAFAGQSEQTFDGLFVVAYGDATNVVSQATSIVDGVEVTNTTSRTVYQSTNVCFVVGEVSYPVAGAGCRLVDSVATAVALTASRTDAVASEEGVIRAEMIYGKTTKTYFFAAGDTDAAVVVEIPVFAGMTKEDGIVVTAVDGEFGAKAYSSELKVTVVDPVANSIHNPYWIGEQTVDTLAYGAWTMDLDVATQKVAQAGTGYTLAAVVGELWCGDCTKMDANLFDTEAFRQWAIDNNIALVMIDVPQDKTGPVPTLLSEVKADVKGKAVSGATYLSRKGIDPTSDELEAIRARNRELRYTTWNWTPGKQRLPTPSLVLIRPDGSVGALERDDTLGGKPTAAILARLDEMLELAADPWEAANNETSTTTAELAYRDTVRDQTIAPIDSADYYKLTDISTPIDARFIVSSTNLPATAELAVALYDATGTNLITRTVGAVGDAGLSLSESLSPDQNYYLSVAPAGTFTDLDVTTATGGTYSVEFSCLLSPTFEEKTYVSLEGSSVSVLVEEGKIYRFDTKGKSLQTGDGLELLDGFATLYYKASVTGEVKLTFPTSSTLEYQIWECGTVKFSALEVNVLENAGEGEIRVKRVPGANGGCTGFAAVEVKLDGSVGSAQNGVRYEWPDRITSTLTWEDGESGEKAVVFELKSNTSFEGQEYFMLELTEGEGGCYAQLDNTPCKVTIFDTTNPCFNDTVYNITLFKGIAANFDPLPVYNIDPANRVTLARTAGSLPPGISLVYRNGFVTLSGRPTRTGSASATYSINEIRPNGTAKTDSEYRTVFNFVVCDAATATQDANGEAIVPNPNFGQTLNFIPAPVVTETNGVRILTGLLTVTVSKAGKITAKYTGVGRSAVSFAGSWSGMAEDGTLSAELVARDGTELALALAADGTAVATLTVADGESVPVDLQLNTWSRANTAADYAGTYTVTFPVNATSTLTGGDLEDAPSGTSFLSLKLSGSSALKTGKATYAGCLANGTSVSGSVVLLPTATKDGSEVFALLPILKLSTKDNLTALLRLKCGDEEMGGAATAPDSIYAADGVSGWWEHRENALAFTWGLDAYGSYLDTHSFLETCCQDYYETTTFTFDVSSTEFMCSRGQLTGAASCGDITVIGSKLSVNCKAAGFSLSFNKSTGVLSGLLPLTFTASDGKTTLIRATYKGVVMPGWTDCSCGPNMAIDLPFASGAVWFTDKKNGKTIKRGLAFDLEAASTAAGE